MYFGFFFLFFKIDIYFKKYSYIIIKINYLDCICVIYKIKNFLMLSFLFFKLIVGGLVGGWRFF